MAEDEFFHGRALAKAKALRMSGGRPAVHDDAPAATPSPTAPARPLPPEAKGKMADVSDKPVVPREAVAEGFLRLRKATLDALAAGTLPKGDPFPAAQVAGILAAKRTSELIPFCHPLPLTHVAVDLTREADGVRCVAAVKTDAKTGVEMEALVAVSTALLTVWDMAKALEKDDRGQYPGTAVEGLRVRSKTKGDPS